MGTNVCDEIGSSSLTAECGLPGDRGAQTGGQDVEQRLGKGQEGIQSKEEEDDGGVALSNYIQRDGWVLGQHGLGVHCMWDGVAGYW